MLPGDGVPPDTAPLTLQPGSMFTLAGMIGLRVSELAARAGVPPSTVRFYERAGLLPTARRAANGYRLFDESVVEDLALIGRVKDAGMRLDDISDVVAAWHGGSCRVLQDRLRAHLTAEAGRVSEQIADLAAFRRKLEATLDRLTAHSADVGAHHTDGDADREECAVDNDARDADGEARNPELDRCGPGCACGVVLSADAPSGGDAPLPGCSLDERGLADRLGQWRAVAAAARAAERDGDTVRLTLNPGMLPAVATLAAAEADCCPQAWFTLEVTAGQAFLIAEVPGIGAELDAQHR
jgi:MerR family copper efflux transcriptional regulator